MIHNAISQHEELTRIRNEGELIGLGTGWKSVDEIYTLKRGYPLFIAGAPHHGKSEFVFDLLLNTSIIHGWKHFVYSGESGSIADTIAELAHKYARKPLRKKINGQENKYAMSDKEYVDAVDFISNHFYFLDPNSEFTLKNFYAHAKKAEEKFGVKFDTTLIDPFNDVEEELTKHGNREDKWLKHELKRVRIESQINNRIDILVNHIADIAPQIDKDSGNRYTPVALPSEWAGGRTWHRRAFTMLLIYRTRNFMKRENGTPCIENETWVINQKAKPKGSGKLGTVSLLWDWRENRFQEIEKIIEPTKEIINFYEKEQPF